MTRSVLISGAGIAGPTLAYWLKAGGFEPTLIERAPALRSGGYVIDFWGHGYDIAERMGLLPEINRVGYRIRELRVVDDDGRKSAAFGVDVFGELTGGRYTTLPRSQLSSLLFKSIEDSCDIIFDAEIVGLAERDDGAIVRLSNGVERRFDIVIGADGLHSQVRSLVFGSQERFERRLGYHVAAFEAEGYRPRDEDVYMMYGQPGRMLGRVSLRDNRTLFLFVLSEDARSGPLTPDRQKDLLRSRYGEDGWEVPQILDELGKAGQLYFDRVSQIRMPGWSNGRVALIGDAAFCPSLLAGQGSALAMISAYVLAGELVRAGGGHRAAFSAYETRMRDYIDAKQKAAERFAGAFAPRTRFGLMVRNLVMNAFALPGLARLVVGREIIDRITLPDYSW